MNTPTDTRCAEAIARLTTQINRAAGQHSRAIKRAFELSKTRLTGTSTTATRIEHNTAIAYIKTPADKPTTKA